MQFRIGNVQFQGHLGLLRHTPLKHVRHQPSDHSVVPRTLWQKIRLFEIKRMDAGYTGMTTMVRHATNEVTAVPLPTQITTPQTLTQSTRRKLQTATTNEIINVKQQSSNSNASGTGRVKQQESPQLQSGFGSLPDELQLPIFGELPGKDLVKIQQVCKRFDRLSNVVISDGKSGGAQEALKKRREFIQKRREFVQERIRQLFHEGGSPERFKINLEKLIAKHRDIGIEMRVGRYLDKLKHIDILLSVLTKQTHLRSLSIHHQQDATRYVVDPMKPIISTLETVSSKCELTELHVDIASDVTQEQADSLANMPALKSITIGYNPQIGYRTLQAFLTNPATANINLTIGDKQEGTAEWALVKQALAGNKTIEKMMLSLITDEALAAIAPALEENKSLRELNLSGNYLTFRGAQALARSLKHNTTLTTLNLRGNEIGSAGIEAIADAALTMKNLKHLNLKLTNGSGGSAMETLRATKPSLKIDL